MKRKLVLSTLSLFASLAIFAQEGLNVANDYVVTAEDTLEGKIEVNMERNDLVLRSGRHIFNWRADKVLKASLIDKTTGERKTYVTGSFGINTETFFFEVLSEGRLSLLYREGLKFSKYDEEVYPPFYILIDGTIHSMPQGKREFLALFDGEYQGEMTDHFKNKGVALDDAIELAAMFSAFNQHYDQDDYLVKARH